MKVRELLSDGGKWTKGVSARDEDESAVGPQGHNAVKWCIHGATVRCYPDHNQLVLILDLITRKLEQSGWGDIARWNDAPERTWKEVKDLINSLDI